VHLKYPGYQHLDTKVTFSFEYMREPPKHLSIAAAANFDRQHIAATSDAGRRQPGLHTPWEYFVTSALTILRLGPNLAQTAGGFRRAGSILARDLARTLLVHGMSKSLVKIFGRSVQGEDRSYLAEFLIKSARAVPLRARLPGSIFVASRHERRRNGESDFQTTTRPGHEGNLG
jgi:hypothetical protein